jgi:hypothetical protein
MALFQVSLQALYKQVGTLLPKVHALRILRLRAGKTVKITGVEGGPSRLAVWTRPPLDSALRCIVFPSGARWEFEHGVWVRINKI